MTTIRKLDIVIPVRNEQASLPLLFDCVTRAFSATSDIHWRMICVDDGSNDASWRVLVEMCETHPQLSALRLARGFGKEAALEAGLSITDAPWILVMDADLEHPPALIAEMINIQHSKQTDIVTAVRRERPPENFFKRVATNAFFFAFRFGAGFEFRETSDFKLISRRAVDAYLALSERRKLFRGLSRWLGFSEARVSFAPVVSQLKTFSSFSTWALLRHGLKSIVSFTSAPLIWIAWTGAITFSIAIILALQTLWGKLTGASAQGFSTVILLQLGIGSVLMLALGIIGIYLAAIYEELKARPIYIVTDQTGSKPSYILAKSVKIENQLS